MGRQLGKEPPHPHRRPPLPLTVRAAGTCLVLAAVMGDKANRSRKVLPAGVVAILSALMSLGYAGTLKA